MLRKLRISQDRLDVREIDSSKKQALLTVEGFYPLFPRGMKNYWGVLSLAFIVFFSQHKLEIYRP